MINVLHGRQGVVPVACRSSRLVPPPWVAAQPSAPVQLVQLLRALGDGASPRPRRKAPGLPSKIQLVSIHTQKRSATTDPNQQSTT